MLRTLKLQNFRKVVDDVMHFTPGINAIRGPNEASKSSRLEAVSYALFGAAGLKETIDDVVTYGQPTNSLRVELDFDVAGVDYTIVRSPKGAELSFGREKVTGQKEVSKFVERLFGASQDMAGKLMLARQKDLGGALSGGPTAAGKMIEDLADLDLIDELIGLIGEKLPAGNTAAQQSTLALLRAQSEVGELEDLDPLEDHVEMLASIQARTQRDHEKAKAKLDELDLDAAREILAEQKRLGAALAQHRADIEKLDADLGKKVELPSPTEAEIAAARAKVEAQKGAAAAAKLHAELKRAGIEQEWDKPLETLHAEVADVQRTADAESAELASVQWRQLTLESDKKAADAEYAVKRTRIEGRLIKETTCAFCQKDLTDVPEVVTLNTALGQELAALTTEHETGLAAYTMQQTTLDTAVEKRRKSLGAVQDCLVDLQAVLKHHDAAELLYARAGEYVELDRSGVPATWAWVGPEADGIDYAPKLRELESERDKAVAAKARRAQQQQQRTTLLERQAADEAVLVGLQIADAVETLELESTYKAQVQALLEAAQQAEREVQAARQAFGMAKQRNEHKIDTAARAKEQLAVAEAQIKEMEANNALIKKLREARPQITDRLWAIVLAAVTTYCSEVRGEKSVITRADGRFKINGRPVSGLSGSAEDVLGLSIRFALTKTFLGNVDFVILDEVAAACDDQRELAMLGLLATSGFEQTILVTHSALADAYAQNVITI